MQTFLGIFDNGWWAACTKNATLEILLMLLAAGIIGWLLHRYWGSGSKKMEAAWQTKYDKLTVDYNNAQKHSKKLKADLEAGTVKLNTYSSSVGENENLKTKLIGLQLQLDNANKDLAVVKAAYNDTHEKLQAAMVPAGDIEVLKSRVANLTEELSAAKNNANTYRAALDAANAEKAKLSSSVQNNEAEELRKKVSKLENDLNSSRLLVTKYQNETKHLDERKAKIEEEAKLVNEQRSESDNLKNKLTRTEEDLTKARNGLGELTQLKNEYAALKSENDKWKNEADVQAKNAAEALQWQDKAGAFEKELAKAKSDYTLLQTEKQNVATELNAAKSSTDEIDGLKNKIGSLENELNVSKNSYGSLKNDYDALLAEKNSLAIKAAAPAPVQKIQYDDLEIIEGIGPKIEKLLYKGGIYTFCQLAETSPENISAILIKEGGENYRIHDPGTWPEQATLLCAGKKDEFEKLAAVLKGGKRVAAAAPEKKDDLKVVEGIGPKIEGLLNGGGIYTYRHLAAAAVDRLKEILHNAGERYKMHDPTSWPQQGDLLADGKLDEFKKLTDSLKGGRVV